MLYITDRNSCFKSEVKETTVILPHADVARADKVAAAHKGAAPPVLALCHVSQAVGSSCSDTD